MAIFASTALALASLVVSLPSTAAEEAEEPAAYLEIKVDGQGELRPETRLALARLLDEDPAADLYYLGRNQGLPVETLCGLLKAGLPGLDRPTCLRELQDVLAQARDLSGYRPPGGGTLRAVPLIATEGNSYALLDKRALQAWPKSSEPWRFDPTPGACATDWLPECSTDGPTPRDWATEPIEIDWAIRPETVEIVAAPLGRDFLKDKKVLHLESAFELPPDPGESIFYTITGDASAGGITNLDLLPKILAYPDDRDGAAALIEEDLSILGSSDRVFRIRSDLGSEEKKELIRTLANEPLFSAVIEEHDAPPTFEFIHPAEVFETAAGVCNTGYQDWPLPATRIAEIMCFNETVRAHLGLGAPRRSRILIVDSGLSAGLAGHPSFASGLYTELSELLSANTVIYESLDHPECADANDNGFYGDVYGAAAGITSKSKLCREPQFHVAQLEPPSTDAIPQQTYFPGHGGFVGGLALGGSELSDAFPNITAYVGLSYFRVVRADKSGRFYTDPDDIKKALAYASKLRADVVNLSLKTDDEATFSNLDPDLFLVTSAGNNHEDLDKPAPNNLPASMGKIESQMLVVGALLPSENGSWWGASAHSTTRVHIAAPGAEIWSYGLDGNKVCSSGTSAAAPLVSFTAAVLKSLGLPTRRSIKSRILASADHDLTHLATRVAQGRKLRVDAALDILVDRIERKATEGGPVETLRGWILPSSGPTIGICAAGKSPKNLEGSRGHIDLSLLWTWRRLSDTEGRFFHEHAGVGPYATDECVHPSGSLTIRLLHGEDLDVPWAEVISILPTPFRAARERTLGLTSGLLTGAADPASFSWCSHPPDQG